jgi:Mg/Co/Ni transporter MgtE
VDKGRGTFLAFLNFSSSFFAFLFLAEISSAVTEKPELFSLSGDSTVREALDLFSKHNILSAPVLSENKEKALGFVDYLDVLAYLVQVCHEERSSRVTPPSTSLQTGENFFFAILNSQSSL